MSYNPRVREYRKVMKEKLIVHYGNGQARCVLCGYSDLRALTIDHINGDGAKHRRIVTDMYTWLTRNNFPPGFRTLCFNCQWVTKAERAEEQHKHRKREHLPYKPNVSLEEAEKLGLVFQIKSKVAK